MSDSAIETVADIEQQLMSLYQELSALRDFEDEASEQDERFDELIASLKTKALNTIDDIRYLVAHKDRANTDKASLILLLAIGFAGEVRANEEARQHPFFEPDQAEHSRSSSDDPPRKEL